MAKEVDPGKLIDLCGGAFRTTAVVQKRLRELVKGARPLVDVPRGRKDLIDVVLRELDSGRIEPTEEFSEENTSVEDIFSTPSTDDDIGDDDSSD